MKLLRLAPFYLGILLVCLAFVFLLAQPIQAECPCSARTDNLFASAVEIPDATSKPDSAEVPRPAVNFDPNMLRRELMTSQPSPAMPVQENSKSEENPLELAAKNSPIEPQAIKSADESAVSKPLSEQLKENSCGTCGNREKLHSKYIDKKQQVVSGIGGEEEDELFRQKISAVENLLNYIVNFDLAIDASDVKLAEITRQKINKAREVAPEFEIDLSAFELDFQRINAVDLSEINEMVSLKAQIAKASEITNDKSFPAPSSEEETPSSVVPRERPTEPMATYNCPCSSTSSVTVYTGDIIYDNGGPSSNYSNGCSSGSSYIVLNTSSGNTIRVSGSLDSEGGYDYLTIYNGNGTGGTILYGPTAGTGISVGPITSTTNSMTIRFYSDGSVTYAGFALTVTVLSSEMVVPSSGSNNYTVCSGNLYDFGGSGGDYGNSWSGYTVLYPSISGNMVRVSGTSGGEGCCDYIRVYNGVGTGGTLLSSTVPGSGSIPTCTSTDASGALTVQFTSDGSVVGWGFNLSISCVSSEMRVPSSGNNTYTVCSGNLYDYGGASGDYGNSWSGYTVLYPSISGNMVRVSGTSGGEGCCDYIRVYNGVGTGGTLLSSTVPGSGSIPTCTSTDASGALTVQFTSDGSVVGWGFNLSISCITPTLPGENCTNAQDLASLSSPFTGTTCGYADDISTCRTGSPDRIWYRDVPNNYTIEIWKSDRNFDEYEYLGYGATCPGTQINCWDNDGGAHHTWTNTTGSTQRVWFILDGYSGGACGSFTLNWTLTAACITPGMPTGLGAIMGNTDATFTWSGGSPAGSPTVSYYYTIYNTSWGVVASGNTTGTSVYVGGLTCNSGYYLYVYAYTSCNGTTSSTATSGWYYTSACYHCYSCGTYDHGLYYPSTSWTTHSSSVIAGGSSTDCKWYAFYVYSGYQYTFSMCNGGGTYSADPHIWLYDNSCNFIVDNDDYCSLGSELIWTATYTGYAYLKVASHNTNAATWTLAYIYQIPCTTPTDPTTYGTATICSGSSASIYATSTNATTIYWYTDGCGSTFYTTSSPGVAFAVAPTSTTTYYARGYNSTGSGCWSSGCGSVTITVNTSSTAPTSASADPASVCEGSSTTITASGGTAGSGSEYYWYSGACPAFTQDWLTQPYGTGSTTVNSVNGILDVTSTGGDPMIYMYSLGSWNPSIYKYIQIRYRVLSGTAGNVEIFYTNSRSTTAIGDQMVSGSLTSDGTWRTITIDMSVGTYWNHSNIQGWRFDWATNSGVRMEIDYISLCSTPLGTGSSITVSPSATTTYYVMRRGYCNSTTCASASVAVNPTPPAPTASADPTTICSGSTSTLTASSSGGSTGPIKALIVYADGSDQGLNAYLTADPRFGSGNVTSWLATSSVPSVGDMTPYNVVITWGNNAYANSTTFGDNLKAYVDAGGGVVVCSFGHYNGGSFGISGGFLSNNYDPIQQTASYVSGSTSIGTVSAPSHQIMSGVSSVSPGYYFQTTTLTSGASAIFYWANSYLGCAVKEIGSGRTVGLNQWPGGDGGSHPDLLIANAAAWAGKYSTSGTTTINWYTTSTGGTAFATGTTTDVSPTSTTTYYAEASAAAAPSGYLNGAGGIFNYNVGDSPQTIALKACESHYGVGNCVTGACGSFSYYYSSSSVSCNCSKPIGQYEWIYSNTGYTTVGADYGGDYTDVTGDGLFVRVKGSNTCDANSWNLALRDLGTATGGGGGSTSNILGSVTHVNASSGNYTLGYSFTPSSNITVTKVRRYFGSKISIWTDGGSLLLSQAVSGTDGVWTETTLSTPLNLTAGTTYRIAAYTGGSNYYWRSDMGSSFSHGVINISYEIGGDAFPTTSDGALWWFVDMVYTTGSGGGTPTTETFNYTGSAQTWTVPTGVSSIQVDMSGAQGYSGGGGVAGRGGRLQATVPVTAGELLYIYVGQAGGSCNSGGWNGGAYASCSYSQSGTGGGASDIRRGGTALSNRILVAGGGGGAGYNWGSTPCDDGGAGGGTTGGRNSPCAEQCSGYGGTPSAGGSGGTYSGYSSGSAGSSGSGGAGASGTGGGGGGGGYYGGGGGSWGGGGGGSSYTLGGASSITHTQGYKTGNGQVIISYTASGSGSSCPSARTPVTVNVNTQSTAPTTISGTTNICSGSSTTLSASGGTAGTGSDFYWQAGGCPVFTQDWNSQPYSLGSTTVNSNTNGILNVTSTTNDPMIFMSGLGSFDPNTYRYVQIRYRVISGTPGTAEIFFYNTAHGGAVGGESATGALIGGGSWYILTIDMWSDPDYRTGGNITGWRYDWSSNAGVNMELDYILLSAGYSVGSGSSVALTPSSTTTYYVQRKGICNSSSCASATVTVYNTGTLGTWTGYASTDWTNSQNWVQCISPTSGTAIIIPDGALTPNDPTLSSAAVGASLNIQAGGILNGGTGGLTLTGNWLNSGVFNPGTSTVYFTGSSVNTITKTSGAETFYNLTINKTGSAEVQLGSNIRVTGDLNTSATGSSGGNSGGINPSGREIEAP